jgi:ABC-type transport system involved in multi-copper enzyme maturation permease subunit
MAENSRRSQFEAFLGMTAVVVIVISILSILATLILSATGATQIPVLLAQLPLLGLPLGFLIVIAMLIGAIIRRSKENRD